MQVELENMFLRTKVSYGLCTKTLMGPILIDFVAGPLIHVVRVCEEKGKNSSQKKIKRSNKWKRIKKNIE